ncbi:MAG: hypothetical protein JJE46_02795 [Acidimicrobiia bacterium]|nr:hypothetical protein [Acidimicrobiia bacterium]
MSERAVSDPVGVPRWRLAAVGAVAVLPIVVACVRALIDGWTVTGDNGLIAIRVHDVFSSHTPLLGVVTSASDAAGTILNHPGPLLFEWLAIPSVLLGRDAGIVVGIGLLNALAVLTVMGVGWRRGRFGGACLTALFASTLAWSMGSTLLYDPWQPHSQMLPALAFLFLAWAVASADLALTPAAVLVGSLVMQTHLTYVFLVPVVLIVAIGCGLWTARTERPTMRPALALGLAIIVGLAAWAPPLIEEATASRGNITRLIGQAGKGSDSVGLVGAVRLSSDVIALPPFWFRPSMRDTFIPPGGGVGSFSQAVSDATGWSTGAAIAAWAVLIALLVFSAGQARRRTDRTTVAAVAVSLAAITAAWITGSTITFGILGLGAHEFRFLWPIAVFVWFTLAWAGWRWVISQSAESARRFARPALAAILLGLVVVSGVNLVASPAGGGPQIVTGAEPVLAELERRLDVPAGDGPVLVEWVHSYFLEPYSSALMSELARRNIDFVVTDRVLIRQFGPTSRFNGRNATSRLFYLDGDNARHRRTGDFRRIAFHDGRDSSADRGTQDRRTVGVFLGPVDGCTPLVRIPTCHTRA